MTFPKEIDFTAWLQEREGICVPEAKVVINSAFWHQGEDGKPDTQWPDKVTFHLGETSTDLQMIFAKMLANFIHWESIPDEVKLGKISYQLWLYNRISFAMLQQMEPHHYPYLRRCSRERIEHVSQ